MNSIAARRARLAAQDPELVRAARAWVADCVWAGEGDLDDLSDYAIMLGVDRHYEGGLRAFQLDGAPV